MFNISSSLAGAQTLGGARIRRVKATGCRCQLETEKGLASVTIVPWPRQDSLPLTQAVKSNANSSCNPTLFKNHCRKIKKKKQLLRGHQGTAETPMPAKAGKPQGGGDQNGSLIARAIQHQMLSRSWFSTAHT